VKEEEEIQALRRRLHSDGVIMICEPKEEEEEKRDKVASLLCEQRLNAISDDPTTRRGSTRCSWRR
jgi:hypothetical protein